jgi:hypothetical protein
MARTAIAAGLASIGRDTSTLAPSAQSADATNGNYIPFTVGSTYGAYSTVLIVANGDSASHNVILRSSGFTGAAGDAANSGIASPQNTVFTQSTVGDLSVTVANGTTRYIGPFTTDRFTQADGSLWIDWSAATSMTIIVMQFPVTVS